MKKITTPLNKEIIKSLRVGDLVEFSGTFYTARDQAHKKICAALKKGCSLPIPKGAIIYYSGPTPAKPGEVIGACGPTTASRMDEYTPFLTTQGYPLSIGKGYRSPAVIEAIRKYQGLYFSALGECGALYQSKIKAQKVVAYPELLSEAIYELKETDFLLIVTIDSLGNYLFQRD